METWWNRLVLIWTQNKRALAMKDFLEAISLCMDPSLSHFCYAKQFTDAIFWHFSTVENRRFWYCWSWKRRVGINNQQILLTSRLASRFLSKRSLSQGKKILVSEKYQSHENEAAWAFKSMRKITALLFAMI